MPDLMIDLITSLDGYAAAENWPGLWGVDSPDYLAFISQPSESEHTTLMGATTYRLMHGFAQASPEMLADLTAIPKIVFSSTLTEPLEWDNSTLVTGDPVAAVRELKETSDRPLRTIGSITLCRALLEGGLVDRFRVGVFPFVTGASGRERIYDGWPDVALEIVDSRTFDNKIQLTEYVPTVLDGPPGA